MYPQIQGKEIPEERRKYLEGFNPLVRFVFQDRNEEPYEWREFLGELLADFLLHCDIRNTFASEGVRMCGVSWNEDEGGIGIFYIANEFVSHCKMRCYDGTPESAYSLSNYTPWFGVQFRDHADPDSKFRNTVKVFTIADEFEKFLFGRNISVLRDNMIDHK